MKWWAWVSLAASMIRGRVFIGSPRPILTSTESVKTRSAWRTVATWARIESNVDVAEVVAVDQDAAGPGVDQPGDQADQGELGVVVLAHDGGARPGGDLDRDVVEQDRARSGSRARRARSVICSLRRFEEMGAARSGAARAAARGTRRSRAAERLAWRIAFRSRIHSAIGIGQARQRDEQDQHRARSRSAR